MPGTSLNISMGAMAEIVPMLEGAVLIKKVGGDIWTATRMRSFAYTERNVVPAGNILEADW
jgi:hypothetical protein